ncbi:hypothetical protein JM18_001452 [Phytophthora kernoviae]|uniref:Amino acid transporter transmembrane domain-containing protein n=2 Tax=Phytophthora kernoviae TaxID=325452 RepID=A0A8T0M1S2_9STRA|nr:hypothetical protein G195_002587 [Phytophthora kernoviae 00238/432]KAG2526121.1 hypothetical protein JM16_004074 [Phytophthora kernoviae]KAG2532068.1 hypothetical protein JM18_001452 [Phytophthora kernoviae]
MTKQPIVTLEDTKMAFSLFCCMCGIGTLGMPGNFARTGPVLGFFATVFMAFANIYASVSMSKVLLLAPNSVKTLLDGLFPGAFSATTWIILMTLMVLPLCLVPTLKEGAGAAFAGCIGTLVADALGVGIVVYGMRGHPSVPSPELSVSQVIGAFGSLSLGYGAGIILPDVQRQHSDPSRMPRVVGATMIFIMCMLMIIGFAPYLAAGCQASGNILYIIYPNSDTGLTSLGFKPNWGSVVLAYLAMQMHISIVFAVLLNPAFYIAERLVLGMHKENLDDIENGLIYQEAGTPVNEIEKQSEIPHASISSVRRSKNQPNDSHEAEVAEATEYRGANAIKYIVLRITIVVVLVILSIIFQDHFSDFADFVGASAITANCILLPTIFYLVKTWEHVPLYEKIPAVVVLVVCFLLGCYSTYTAGKNLFAPSDSDVEFPYCDAEYENTIYYNQTV